MADSVVIVRSQASPLDVEGVDLGLSAEEIVSAVREVRAALVPLSQLSEPTEQQRLAELEARGLVTLPQRTGRGFEGSAVPNRGKLASQMVSEDRR